MYKQNQDRNYNNTKKLTKSYAIDEEEVSINLESSFGDMIKTNNEHLNLITCHSSKYKMLTAKTNSLDIVSTKSSKPSLFDLLDESNESDISTKSNFDYNGEFFVDDSLIEDDDDQSVAELNKEKDKLVNKAIDQIITIDDNNDEDEVKIEKETGPKKTKGRKHDYEAIDYDAELEKQIDDARYF